MYLTKEKLEKKPPLYFPPDFDPADWEQISAAFDEIIRKPVTSPVDLLDLLYQASELTNLIYEDYKQAHLKTQADTNDVAAQAREGFLLQNIIMPAEQRVREVLKLYYEHPMRDLLNQDNYHRLNQMASYQLNWAETGPDDKTVEINALVLSYQQIINNISVFFEGTTCPLKAVTELLPKITEEKQEELWKARKDALRLHRNELAEIMDKLIKARHALAVNAGHKNYYELALSTGFYGDMDIVRVSAVHNAIQNAVLPAVRQIIRQRKKQQKLKSLRPWDLESEPLMAGLHPFSSSEELVEKAISVLFDVRFEYGMLLNKMHNSGFLDLDYRPEKVRGEYYTVFSSYGAGHILMNCSGKHRDMIMLFHEMGHVLQSVNLTKQILGEFTFLPVPVRELASQSMVYLTTSYWDSFYPDEKDRRVALQCLMEHDLFQLLHWSILNSFELAVYANPDWTPGQREKAMLDICRQYDWGTDLTDAEEWQAVYWMLEQSLFDMPLYNFFSALSILDVWQIYHSYRRNPTDTMTRFQNFIESGSEISNEAMLKELGIKRDYSEHHIRKLIENTDSEIRKAGK